MALLGGGGQVSVPINLKLEVLQSSLAKVQEVLDKLTPNSKGFKELQGIVSNITRSMEKLQVQTAKPFGSQQEFTQAQRTIDNIEQSFQRIGFTVDKINFSDLKLDETQTAKLKEFSDEIERVKKRFEDFKDSQTTELIDDSRFAKFKDTLINSSELEGSFEQVTKNVRKKITDIVDAYENGQRKIDTINRQISEASLAQGMRNNGFQDSQTKQVLDQYKQYFTTLADGTLDYKQGQKSAFFEYLKSQFTLTSDQINELQSKSAEELQQIITGTSFFDQIISKGVKANKDKGEAVRNQAELEQKYQAAVGAAEALAEAENRVGTAREQASAKTQQAAQNQAAYQAGLVASIRSSQQLEAATRSIQSATDNYRAALASANAEMLRQQQRMNTFNGIKNAIVNFMGFNQILNLTRRAIKGALDHIKELDKTMNQIAVVTNMTTADLWKQVDAYTAIAQKYGVTIQGAYEVSKIYYQAGYDTNEVLTLTNETLKLSKIASLDYATSTDYMMTAMRGFKLEMEDASRVVDVYSNLASHTAVSQAELAEAMTRTASSLQSVGATFEESSAMIATMVAVTRESANNIGSALKSIASRYGELKKDPTALFDAEGEAMDFNKVDTALKSVGISLQTVDHQFRDFTDVIVELSEKWDTLNSAQQRYIATQFAGNRQQSRFLALVSNADLLKENIENAENAEGVGDIQAATTLEGLEAKINQVNVALQQFYTTIGIESVWKTFLDGAKNMLTALNKMPKIFNTIPAAAIIVVMNAITFIKNILYRGVQSISQTVLSIFNEAKGVSERAAQEQVQQGQNYVSNFIKGLKIKTPELISAVKTLKGQATGGHVQGLAQAQQRRDQAIADYDKFTGLSQAQALQQKLNTYIGGTNYQKGNKFSTDSQALIAEYQQLVAICDQYGIKLDSNAQKLGQMRSAVQGVLPALQQKQQELEGNVQSTQRMVAAEEQAIIVEKKLAKQKLASSIQQIASGMSMLALMLNDGSRSGEALSGVLQGVAGALYLVTASISANPIGAAITGITMVITSLSQIIETTTEKVERLQKEAEELQSAANQAKSDQKILETTISKYEKLSKTRYESAEAAEEYQTAVDDLASKYPELIDGIDELGNITIREADLEYTLAEARKTVADATLAAAEKEIELAKGKKQKTIEEIDSSEVFNVLSRGPGQLMSVIGADMYGANGKGTFEEFWDNIKFTADTTQDNAEKQYDLVKTYINLEKSEKGSKEYYDALRNFYNEGLAYIREVNGLQSDTEEAFKAAYGDIVKQYEQLDTLDRVISGQAKVAALSIVDSTYSGINDDKIKKGLSNKAIRAFIAQDISNDAEGKNWEEYKKAANTRLVNAPKEYIEWYSNLEDTQQQILDTMFGEQDKYSAQDIISALDIKDSNIVNTIISYYSTNLKFYQDSIKKRIEQSGITYYEDDLVNLNSKQDWNVISGILSEYDRMVKTGLIKRAENYYSYLSNFYTQLEGSSLDRQIISQIESEFLENGFGTKEGLEATLEYIKNLDIDPRISKQLQQSLSDASNKLVENYALSIQTEIDSFTSEWEDSEKELKKLRSGMNFKEANEFIKKARALGIKDISTDSFIIKDGELILTETAFNTYWTAFKNKNLAISQEWLDLYQSLAGYQNVGQADLDTLFKDNLEWLSAIATEIGANIFVTDEENNVTGIVADADKIWNEAVRIYCENYELFGWMAEQAEFNAENQANMAKGIYQTSTKNRKYDDRQLKKIATSTTLDKENYEDRAIKEYVNKSYSTFISDLLSKGFEEINIEDYEGLTEGTKRAFNRAKLTKNYTGFIEAYAEYTGKTAEEIQQLYIQALQKMPETANTTNAINWINNQKKISYDELVKIAMALENTTVEDLLKNAKIKKNDDNQTYDISAFIDDILYGLFKEDIPQFVEEALKDTVDYYTSAITDATSLATKGTNKYTDVTKFIKDYKEVVGEDLSSDAFGYNAILDAWTLNTEFLRKYIEAQADILKSKEYLSADEVDKFVQSQVDQILAQNIDIMEFINSSEKNGKAREKLINALTQAYGDTKTKAEIEQWVKDIEAGGDAAVAVAKMVAESKETDLSPEDIEKIYNSVAQKQVTFAKTVSELAVGQYIADKDLQDILNSVDSTILNENNVVTSVENMVAIYKEIYNRLQDSAGRTTAQLNSVYAQYLTAGEQKDIDAISILSNAMGMTYDALGELLARYGQSLKDFINNQNNGIQKIGNGKVRITDFKSFAAQLGINEVTDTEEYTKAYEAYVESLMSLETSAMDKITESYNNALGNLNSWKPFNVSKLNSAYQEVLKSNGAADIDENGIARIKDGAQYAKNVLTILTNLSSLDDKALFDRAGITREELGDYFKNAVDFLQGYQNAWKGIGDNLTSLTTNDIAELISSGGLDIKDIETIITRHIGDCYIITLEQYKKQLESVYSAGSEVDRIIANSRQQLIDNISGLDFGNIINGTASGKDLMDFTETLYSTLFALGIGEDEIAKIFQANNGNIKIDVSKLQETVKSIDAELGKKIQETLVQSYDSGLESIGSAMKLFSEGTDKQEEINKFTQEYNKLLGKNADSSELFKYDDVLNAYTLNFNNFNEYKNALRKYLSSLGLSNAIIDKYIAAQTEQLTGANIDIQGFISSANIYSNDSIETQKFLRQLLQWGRLIGEVIHNENTWLQKQTDTLLAGGKDAVDLLIRIKGDNATSEEIQAVYKSQYNRLQEALSQVSATAGQIITGQIISIFNASGYTLEKLDDGTAVVKAVGDTVKAYNRIYAAMKADGNATTKELNDIYVSMLQEKDKTRTETFNILEKAAEMTYADLGEILNQRNILLEEVLSDPLKYGLGGLANGNIRITDIKKFIEGVKLDTDISDSIYNELISAYNDSLIELDREVGNKMLDEINSIAGAHTGERINVAYLTRTSEGIKNILSMFGDVSDGILEIRDASEIPTIIAEIARIASEEGILLSSELAELADTVNEFLTSIISIISNGITGGLKNTEANELQQWAQNYGIQVDFVQTADGLKIALDSAIQLYNKVKEIDGIQGKLLFDDLNDSLQESNDHYQTVSANLARIEELQTKINKAGNDTSDKRIQQYQRELDLAKEIALTRATTEDSSYNFMEQKMPGGFQNPINYYESWAAAVNAVKTAGKNGFMEIQDFYNMVNEVQNLAVSTGRNIVFMGQEFNKDGTTAGKLIEQGMKAMTIDTNSGKAVLKLSSLLETTGMMFAMGSAGFSDDVDDGIKDLAKGQIKMLDGIIRVLEMVVQMQQLEDIAGEDNTLDLKDLFPKIETGDTTLDDAAQKWVKQLLSAEADSDIMQALKTFTVNGETLYDLFKKATSNVKLTKEEAEALANVLSAFYQMNLSDLWNSENPLETFQEILANAGFDKGITIDLGKDIGIVISGGQVVKIDWESDTVKKAVEILNNDQQKVTELIVNGLEAVQNDNELIALYTLKGKVTYGKNGIPTIEYNGQTYTGTKDVTEILYRSVLEDLGIKAEEIEIKDDKAVGIKYVGTQPVKVSYGENGLECTSTVTGETYDSLEDFAHKDYLAYVQDILGNGHGQVLDENFIETESEWIWINYHIPAKIQTSITDKNGNPVSLKNNKEVQDSVRKMLDEARAGGNGGLTQGRDGNFEVELSGGYKLKLSPEGISSNGKIDSQALANELADMLGIETAMENTITAGITAAIPNIIEALRQIDSDALKSAADYMQSIVDSAQTFAGQTYETVKSEWGAINGLLSEALANLNSMGGKTFSATIVTSSSGEGQGSAKGNVALAKGTKTLMGELGPELYVTNGRYYVAGQTGAEFVDLPNDAIVFNHLQTKRLLGNGSTGRGKPVTNAKNAVSYAKGNATGPAKASAQSTLDYLKSLRAQWQSLLNISAKDLANTAGGGGGGDEKQLKNVTTEIQRWYNLLRQIDKLEKDINYQESLRSKIQSDRIANGRAIYQTYKQELSYLDQEIARNKELANLQKSWYDKTREELANSAYGKIFTYDENGLQQYVGDSRPGSGLGLDILENLTKMKVTGEAVGAAKNVKTQLDYLKSVGFDIEALKFNNDGTTIDTKKLKGDKLDEAYVQMMQNFWDSVDGWRDKLDGIYDSYHEQLTTVIENEEKRNGLLQEIVDNQLSVEQSVMKAIEEREQAEIDRMQEERDAISDAADKFLDGLSEQLEREQKMYEQNETNTETDKLRRQLAILQRSGGSASQIRSLENEIRSRDQDAYFQAQQDQIDAIKEASDKQIEKMDHQIDIMTETLEYQKEHGLLWNEVYQIMAQTPEEIEEFIVRYTPDFESNSALQTAEDLRKLKNEIEVWISSRDDSENPIYTDAGHNWNSYLEASQTRYKNILTDDIIAQAKTIFDSEYIKSSDPNAAGAAADAFLNQKLEEYNKAHAQTTTSATTASEVTSSGSGSGKYWNVFFADGGNAQKRFFSKKEAEAWRQSQLAMANRMYAGIKYAEDVPTADKEKSKKEVEKWKKATVKAYSKGGLADYTGLAMVHGSKTRPEAFLNAEQTEMWKKDILGKNNSLTSLLLDFTDALSGMANESTYGTINHNGSVVIEHAEVNMNVDEISNDYDARRAGASALEEMLNIARKSGTRGVTRG